MKDVDDKLDEIEQIMALYEAKLDSVPEEYYTDLPEIPEQQLNLAAEPEVIARTDNPLQNMAAGQVKAPVTMKEDAVIKAAQTNTYVPPPPKDGPMIKPPVGMPNARTFPISTHAPPPSM